MLSSVSPSAPLTLRPSVGTMPLAGPAAAAAPGAVTGATVAGSAPATDFASVLGQMALDAVNTVKVGEQTAIAGIKGQATVQEVAEAVMASEQTLQASIAVRDKVVAAYLEISRMSI